MAAVRRCERAVEIPARVRPMPSRRRAAGSCIIFSSVPHATSVERSSADVETESSSLFRLAADLIGIPQHAMIVAKSRDATLPSLSNSWNTLSKSTIKRIGRFSRDKNL